MCIPGTNASVFSTMNTTWTDEKNRFHVTTIKLMLIVKIFFKETCCEFHNLLLKNWTYKKKFIALKNMKKNPNQKVLITQESCSKELKLNSSTNQKYLVIYQVSINSSILIIN